MTYIEIVEKHAKNADKKKMEILTEKTDDFVELMRDKHPAEVAAFLSELEDEFAYFLSEEEAKKVVAAMENESPEHPRGEKWSKEATLQAFREQGYSTSSARYSENGVYYAMNMVYSDYYPMYGNNVKMYVEHAYLFLNDKDYKGEFSKEKWSALKK